jgi:hypothetical protein
VVPTKGLFGRIASGPAAAAQGVCNEVVSRPNGTRTRPSSGSLERVRRERGCGSALTLVELVDEYLAQNDGEPETIEKLRWLLTKPVKAFGTRRLPELRSQEIAAWRMTISSGHRFEATQALRQVLARAVVWGMDVNPAKHGADNPQRRYTEKRPFESWAELAAVTAKLGARNGPMVIFAAATGLRGRVDRARAARSRSAGPRRLRAPRLQERPTQVHEDPSQRTRGAATGDRTRSARATTRE